MELAGIDIPDAVAHELVVMLRRADYAPTADTLDHALENQIPIEWLGEDDRTAILAVLDGLPDLGGDQLQPLVLVLQQAHAGPAPPSLPSTEANPTRRSTRHGIGKKGRRNR